MHKIPNKNESIVESKAYLSQYGVSIQVNKDPTNINDLLDKIELTRFALMKTVQSYGYNDEKTIRISHNLDQLILEFQKYHS
ncbi:aspartyl-phosphate phosphatase Spo0E family protein [Bacillus sp. J37]|uniref:aspartyl-phosphate phosphatase Spo0E family protein n=1 Tax=Bacillus sp. J37 TaxID=935837 RepID=UPI00047E2A2F|nr:aspartyl-phosphate phosphatase Spo0E family protein [Bacillus sp. J37]